MKFMSKSAASMVAMAMMAAPVAGSIAHAQGSQDNVYATVYGQTGIPADAVFTDGPDIDGVISARSGDRMMVTTEDGNRTVITIDDNTQIKATGGFLGLNKSTQPATSLMNGMPVSVETKMWNGKYVASKIDMKSKDLKIASMIHNGTDQRFTSNEQATEALKGRMGDLDQYNIKATTNVNFAVNKYGLTEEAKDDLCATANTAEGMDNALLLVVGYTDADGPQEYNQILSEKRAASVVNYLQQACGWKPYRMLTPTGMAEADPVADNESEYGKAQNRRVAVNVLVSKAVDGL
ncbi:OmpA family protein [Croceicoccus bisphenolivorans]|uniref:OmpA family protein n=1 Tax=Croceicoccus bisphenolivorans TaxID=1783232 RepID=UPI0008298899|nr:OmpA family protein [Croceicoccus bisphenolivorans]